ncbi:MAG: Na/Pi symporter [Chthoniobacterales bacterium]
MVGVHTFFLGLGLFFAGLLMTGDRMRQLTGVAFHRVAQRVASPFFGGTVGLGFGALMQSATAVTFILVSMVRTELITSIVALPIILWANVGLTALSFVAVLNIHSAIAWIVGLAGIALGLLKVRSLTPWAGLVFGVGLILFGLQTMGEGAAPLKGAEWFHAALAMTTSSPALAFLAGVFAATILQSNVGTVLLTATLAQAGALSLETAAMIIYGANLGAIFLRIFLSIGMDRPSFRLIRFEDFFCIWSGLVMSLLFVLEMMGVPLVMALVKSVTRNVDFQIAGIFLLSNFIPALLLHPWRNLALRLLTRLWPGELPEDHSKPKFLDVTALDHPPTAIELVQKELARLLRKIRPQCNSSQSTGNGDEFQPGADFINLSLAIEHFLSELVSHSDLDAVMARAVQYQRAELSMIRHLGEAGEQFSQYVTQASEQTELRAPCEQMLERINALITHAVSASSELNSETIASLHTESGKKQSANLALRDALRIIRRAAGGEIVPLAESVAESFGTILWILHRYARLLQRGVEEMNTK